jgi:hypothetical protein
MWRCIGFLTCAAVMRAGWGRARRGASSAARWAERVEAQRRPGERASKQASKSGGGIFLADFLRKAPLNAAHCPEIVARARLDLEHGRRS